MKELTLKYGCNPNQIPAKICMKNGEDLPIQILNGSAGYINLLDAFNAWQLVKELKEATGLASAASFKHVSPAGAAVAFPLDETDKIAYQAEGYELSDMAAAYIRARGADRLCSFGDFAALSDECDVQTAKYLQKEVSDGIIAPSYSEEALEILKSKRRGNYLIIQIDPDYVPEPMETKQVFGITFEQKRNDIKICKDIFDHIVTKNKEIPESSRVDLLISLITLKYTQSNSICYAYNGQTIGIGAGQQSRIHCTRLAGNKADLWFLRRHPKVLGLKWKEGLRKVDKDNTIDIYISEDHDLVLADGQWEKYFTEKPEVFTKEEKDAWHKKMENVALGSDAFFPFEDNIERAAQSGVKYVAQPGGSVRDEGVLATCDEKGMAMVFTGYRLFHH